MSNIAVMGNVNNALVRIDQICDYVPIASTITNFVDIFEKCAFKVCCSSESINSNRYFSHINDKSILRCVTLLVPILGNIIVGIYDHIEKRNEKENQDHQARILGLEVSQLPQSISERRQIIENKEREILQKILNVQIVSMRQSIEKFGKIIENPDEPLEVDDFFEREIYYGTHKEKIDLFWTNLKLQYAFQKLGSVLLSLAGLDQNEVISQKQQEISELKKELSQLRQTSYHGHVQSIGKEELLQEAQKYYLVSFSKEEREGIKVSVELMTLDTILPKLKERVLANAKNDLNIVEMQEIISQIEQI